MTELGFLQKFSYSFPPPIPGIQTRHTAEADSLRIEISKRSDPVIRGSIDRSGVIFFPSFAETVSPGFTRRRTQIAIFYKDPKFPILSVFRSERTSAEICPLSVAIRRSPASLQLRACFCRYSDAWLRSCCDWSLAAVL